MKKTIEKQGFSKPVSSKKKQILVVDDEVGDLLTGDSFSLILIDIRMPILSGYEILRLMREKVNHNSKMIFVSIVPEKEVNMEGSDGFIQKPFSPETFMSKVKETLGE